MDFDRLRSADGFQHRVFNKLFSPGIYGRYFWNAAFS